MQQESNLPVCAVFGASGKQGCSVGKHLAEEKCCKIRLIYRDKQDEEKIKSCAERIGGEYVMADLNAPETLKHAFSKAAFAFLVTNFWESDCMSEDKECLQAKNAIDAAKAAGVKHLIFSAAENTEKTTGGKIKVPHYVGKGKAAEYLQASGLSYTLIKVPFYYENFLADYKPQKRENGKIYLDFPLGSSKIPLMSVDDVGVAVKNICKNHTQYNGKTIFLGVELLNAKELCELFTEVISKPVEISELEVEAWAKQTSVKNADIAACEWKYLREFPNIAQQIHFQETKELIPHPKRLRDFLMEHKQDLI